jgi:hypothetical protein
MPQEPRKGLSRILLVPLPPEAEVDTVRLVFK